MSVRNTILPIFFCILLLASFALPATPWRHIINDFMFKYIPMTQKGSSNSVGTYQVKAYRNEDGGVTVSGSGHIPYDGPVAGTVSFEVNPSANTGSYQVTEKLFDDSVPPVIRTPNSLFVSEEDNEVQGVNNPFTGGEDRDIPIIYRDLDNNGTSRD